MRKRVAYSQNFLRDEHLVAKLVGESSIRKNDTVYEIGAGQGIITEELIKVCKKSTEPEWIKIGGAFIHLNDRTRITSKLVTT